VTDHLPGIWSVSLLTLLLSCGDAGPVELDEIGDPCRSNYSFCVDPSSVQRCEHGIWTVAPCETVCGELGMAYVSEGCDETCDCVLLDPEGCTPGDSVCANGSEVSVCDGAQLWSNFECLSVCGDSGLASVGCMAETEGTPASCWCTSEGTACEPGDASICVDEAALAVCVDGAWVFQACGDICNGSGICVPSGDPHECACR
jgi:hypothetical protein